MSKLDLTKLSEDEWDDLIWDRAVVVTQNGKQYMIIIPQSIDLEKNLPKLGDLIITEHT